jgi:two-component system sensor histidine kinase VicK
MIDLPQKGKICYNNGISCSMTSIPTYALLAALSVLLIAVFLFEYIAYQRLMRENRDRKMMVALLSHRLRTPLTSMKWYLEMLLDSDFGKLQIAQLELLNHLNMSATDAIGILNTFLETSRIERNHNGSDKAIAVDIENAANMTVANLKTTIMDRKQTIDVHAAAPHITALANPLTVHMILEVLLHNAMKYTPDGGKITVDIGKSDKVVSISVWDSGISISKEDQKRLFTKFFRGKGAIAIDTNGNGLGLYLVKDMLKEIGGTIHAESNEGQGARFIVEIPNREAEIATATPAAPLEAPAPLTPPPTVA